MEWILKDVSFVIEPDQTAAIVGHTGAGKTTIIGLMMRFYEIQRGSVLINGVDVREQDVTELRRNFGVVLQDPFLFTGTIAENIRLGSDWITDERMKAAADEVNVGDFIRALPQGFDEPLRERGNSLSTGQKQLINFARALAHDPRILVLDEATSSVDTDTEMRVRSALERMVQGRTSVIIAHRLSTVQQADRILVMHKGVLRELGTHQELLAQRGIYWKLYQLQYKDQEVRARAGIQRLFGRQPGRRHRLDMAKIFLSAGEASGEHYGALLMAEYAAWSRRLTFSAWAARAWRPRAAPGGTRRRCRGHGHHGSDSAHGPCLSRIQKTKGQPARGTARSCDPDRFP